MSFNGWLLSFEDIVTPEEINLVKHKLQYKIELNNHEVAILEFLLDNDRDFIMAPQYNFSVKYAMDIKPAFSLDEISRFFNCSISEIYSVECKAIKNVLKKCGLEDMVNDRIASKKERKERETIKCGEKIFDYNGAMRYIVYHKNKKELPNSVCFDEDFIERYGKIFCNNMMRACEVANRTVEEEGLKILNLKNLPVLKRGRKAKNHMEKMESAENQNFVAV